MEFRLLGPLQLIDDTGTDVPIGGGRERTLLALLLLSANRVLSSTRLVDELWGDRPPDDPAHALRVHVSRLRRALRGADSDGVLVTRSPGYVVAVDTEAVDLGRFELLVTEARQCAARGDHAGAATTLRAALALWRGPALVDLGDTPSIHAEAVRLEELRLAAIEDRVEADLTCGRHVEVIAELDSLTRAHPLRERLWGLRMLALYRAGRPADALRAYQELRTVLGDDLGLEPSPALARLEGAILRHDPELDWSVLSRSSAATRSTKYARVDGVNIAYQVVGDGPIDIVVVPGFVSNVDSYWDNPGWTQIFDRLSQLGRLILWDKRGTGLSDPVSRVPTLDERVDDLMAVMDAAGSDRPVLLGVSEGGPMALLFAATHPDRVHSVVLYGVSPRFSANDDWPYGFSTDEQADLRRELEELWGNGALMGIFAPTEAGDDTARRAWGRSQRAGASPTMGLAVWDAMMATDCRDILSAVRVPTLVLHRFGDRVASIEGARHIAARIPGARLLEAPGENHLLPVGEVGQFLDEIERFVGGSRTHAPADRVLTTVVCVDLAPVAGGAVDVPEHRARWRAAVADFGGRAVTTDGAAFVAAFAAPSRAIAWASATRESRPGGSPVRIGVHTGECEISNHEIHGLAIAIAASAATLAAPGEILVTAIVKDLLVGAGLDFADRGVHRLPDVPGEWSLFAV